MTAMYNGNDKNIMYGIMENIYRKIVQLLLSGMASKLTIHLDIEGMQHV